MCKVKTPVQGLLWSVLLPASVSSVAMLHMLALHVLQNAKTLTSHPPPALRTSRLSSAMGQTWAAGQGWPLLVLVILACWHPAMPGLRPSMCLRQQQQRGAVGSETTSPQNLRCYLALCSMCLPGEWNLTLSCKVMVRWPRLPLGSLLLLSHTADFASVTHYPRIMPRGLPLSSFPAWISSSLPPSLPFFDRQSR